jgi:neutral ceramidase
MTQRVLVDAAGRTDGVLRAAACDVDITPDFGWYRTGFAEGSAIRALHGRLLAHVLLIDDGRGERVAWIAADLHAGTRLLFERVAWMLAAEHPSLGLDLRRILLTGTHTHSGPWRIYGSPFHDANAWKALSGTTHPLIDVVDGMAKPIAAAVVAAAGALVPARVGIGTSFTTDLVHNRSLGAARRNALAWPTASTTAAQALAADEKAAFLPDAPPDLLESRCAAVVRAWTGAPGDASGDLAIVDRRVRAVWAEGTDGTPLGAQLTFAAHAAMMPARCGVGSADFFGWAAQLLGDRLIRSGARPAIGFCAGSTGDSDPVPVPVGSPAWEAMLVIRRDWHAPHEREGTSVLAWTKSLAERLSDAGLAAIRDARERLVTQLPIVHRFVERSAFSAPPPQGLAPPGVVPLLATPQIGWPTVRGSELGRGPFSHEGARDLRYEAGQPQSPKLELTLMPIEIMATHPLHLVRLGETWLVGLPGEPTTFFARLMAEAVDPADPARPIILGVSGDYRGYLTTPHEYVAQHYEGASTLCGRHTARFYFHWLSRAADPSWPEEPLARDPGFLKAGVHADVAYPLLRHRNQPERADVQLHIAKVEGSLPMVEVQWSGRLPADAEAIRGHDLATLSAFEGPREATFRTSDRGSDGLLTFTRVGLSDTLVWIWRVLLPKPFDRYTSIEARVREWHGAPTEHVGRAP